MRAGAQSAALQVMLTGHTEEAILPLMFGRMITSLQLHIQQYTNVSVRQTAAKVTCSGGWQPCPDDLFIMELPHRSRQTVPPLTRTGLREGERQLDSDRFHLSLSQPAPTGQKSAAAPPFRGETKPPGVKNTASPTLCARLRRRQRLKACPIWNFGTPASVQASVGLSPLLLLVDLSFDSSS